MMNETLAKVKQEQETRRAALVAELDAVLEAIGKAVETLAALRRDRDELEAAIRELTPRKPRKKPDGMA